MSQTLLHLAAALAVVLVIFGAASTPSTAVVMSLVMIAVLAVVATVTSGNPQDLVNVLNAVTDLIRGRPKG